MSSFTFSEEINQAQRNISLRDWCTVSDKYFDAFYQDSNRQLVQRMYCDYYIILQFCQKQVETAVDRSKVERHIFNIPAVQPIFMCSGKYHFIPANLGGTIFVVIMWNILAQENQ
eukprot:5595304-Ditylum_brightwellii.AAC.1